MSYWSRVTNVTSALPAWGRTGPHAPHMERAQQADRQSLGPEANGPSRERKRDFLQQGGCVQAPLEG